MRTIKTCWNCVAMQHGETESHCKLGFINSQDTTVKDRLLYLPLEECPKPLTRLHFNKLAEEANVDLLKVRNHSKISRSTYQKVVEENRRLRSDIKVMVGDDFQAACDMKAKWRQFIHEGITLNNLMQDAAISFIKNNPDDPAVIALEEMSKEYTPRDMRSSWNDFESPQPPVRTKPLKISNNGTINTKE